MFGPHCAVYNKRKARPMAGLFVCARAQLGLKFFVEVADRARDVDAAGDAALAVLYALDDARRLAALGTVGRLRRVHYLLAVTCFGNLGHRSGVLLLGVSLHTHAGTLRAASTSRSVARLWPQYDCAEPAGLALTSLHQGSAIRARGSRLDATAYSGLLPGGGGGAAAE